MKIALGSDHRGIELRLRLASYLSEHGQEPVDFGPTDPEGADYPDYAGKVAQAVSDEQADRGILICGSGVGMAITANKFPRVRAAVCQNPETASLTRLHNGINVLCLSATQWASQDLFPIVEAFLAGEFEGGRHQRRLDKITEIEKRTGC